MSLRQYPQSFTVSVQVSSRLRAIFVCVERLWDGSIRRLRGDGVGAVLLLLVLRPMVFKLRYADVKHA